MFVKFLAFCKFTRFQMTNSIVLDSEGFDPLHVLIVLDLFGICHQTHPLFRHWDQDRCGVMFGPLFCRPRA